MNIQTINVDSCAATGIAIGRRGSYDTQQIVFDLSALIAEYGNGSAALLILRPTDTTPYPATATQSGTELTWTVSATDTAIPGAGECELFWYVDGGLAKSVIYPLIITEDIIGTDVPAPPDPYETWIEELTALGAETLENAQNAAQSATAAAASETAAAQSATNAEEAAEEAASSEEAATSAKNDAISAKNSAESSKNAAGEYSASAATSAASAATSATNAATAAETATAKATQAASSAAAAATSAGSASDDAAIATAQANGAKASATTAAGSASTAIVKAGEAAASAVAAAISATHSLASASASSGSASTASAKATEAAASASAASGKATEAANSATAAQTAQTGAEAAQAAAEAVLESIPEDYSELSDDVSELKNAFDERALLSFTPSFEDNKFVYAPNGNIGNNVAFALSAFIKTDNIYRIFSGFSTNYSITFYDEHLQYIGYQNVTNAAAIGEWVVLEPPTNAKYFRYVTYKAATPFADTKVEYLNGASTVNKKTAEIETYGLDRTVTFTEVETEGYINLSGNVVNANNFKRTNPFILYEGEHVTIDAEGLQDYVAILSKYDGAYAPIISSAYNALARYEADIVETGLYAMSYLKRSGVTISAKINETTVMNELQSLSGTEGNICDMYDHFTFIGDSITWSQVYTDSSNQRRAFKTYPQVFASLCNAESHEYATPGDTPILWWERSSTGAFDNHGLYIVFLGINGGLTDTIDIDCVGTDPNTFASTNTGQYGRILQTIVNNGDCAVLIKPYGGGGPSLSTTNSVIEKFGAKYGMPVIAITSEELTDLNLHYFPDKSGTNMLHFNDLGYAWLANEVLAEINNLPLSEQFKIMRKQ